MKGSSMSALSSATFADGKIMRKEIIKSRIPPAILNDGCVRPRKFRMGFPARRNPYKMNKAISNSRATTIERRRRSNLESTALNTGAFPNGSMIKKMVTDVDAISLQFKAKLLIF